MNPITTTASAPQHLRALARANEVRLARAELKRRIARAELSVGEVVLECPWEAQSMTVSDLLLSQPRWGHTRCREFLAGIPMSEAKVISSMTERQRIAVNAVLRRQQARGRRRASRADASAAVPTLV